MATDRDGPAIRQREEKWDEKVTAQLPELLTRLLHSPIYGLNNGRGLPPIKPRYGVYLFSEKGRPRYVGRVGLTDRSKRAGKAFSSFRTRLQGHGRARHNEGTYAYARTVKYFHSKKRQLAKTRKLTAQTQSSWLSFAVNASAFARWTFKWWGSPIIA